MSRIKSSYDVWNKGTIAKILRKLKEKGVRRGWTKGKLVERLQEHSIKDVLGAALKSDLVSLAKKLDIPFTNTTKQSLIDRITALEPVKKSRRRVLSTRQMLLLEDYIHSPQELQILFQRLHIPFSSQEEFYGYCSAVSENKEYAAWILTKQMMFQMPLGACTESTRPMAFLLGSNPPLGVVLSDLEHGGGYKNSSLQALIALVESDNELDDEYGDDTLSLNNYFYAQEESVWSRVVHILNRALEDKEDFYVLCTAFSIPLSSQQKLDHELEEYPRQKEWISQKLKKYAIELPSITSDQRKILELLTHDDEENVVLGLSLLETLIQDKESLYTILNFFVPPKKMSDLESGLYEFCHEHRILYWMLGRLASWGETWVHEIEELELDYEYIELIEPLKDLKGLRTLALVVEETKPFLPPWIKDFSSLKRLDLNDNHLHVLSTEEWKTFFSRLCQIPNLTHLEMRSNQLGCLPATIGNLEHLEELQLFYNQVSMVPESIGNLRSMRCLNLSSNQITALPESIGNLTQLTELDLYNNQLSSVPESIGNLTNLNVIRFGDNKISHLPSSIGKLQKLEFFDVCHNKIKEIPPSLWSIKGLNQLWLSANEISSLSEEIGNLINIENISLSDNAFTVLPQSIGNLTKVTELDLNENQLRSLPKTLSQLTQLETLRLYSNSLTTLPQELSKLKKLTKLVLSGNKLTTLPESISQMSSLEELDIDDNQLRTLLHSIGNLTKISTLDVSNNQLTCLPESIGKLKNLTKLWINNNQLTCLPESIGKLKNLTRLRGNNNQLSALPDSIGKLKKLIFLELEKNHLRILPNSIGGLKNLKHLYCRDNPIQSLPDSIGLLKHLETLSLIGSTLSTLPKSIAQLRKLETIHLKNNPNVQLSEDLKPVLRPYVRDEEPYYECSIEVDERIQPQLNQLKLSALSTLSRRDQQKIAYLNLEDQGLTLFPEFICTMSNLQCIYLQGNQLRSLPAAIGNLRKLETLCVSSNRLSEIPKSTIQLTKLSQIELENNSLSALPAIVQKLAPQYSIDEGVLEMHKIVVDPPLKMELGKLRVQALSKLSKKQRESLTHIRLTNIHCSEQLWEECFSILASCPNLESLDLSHCNLKRLPRSIGQLKKLSELTLSDNQFAVFPDVLCDLIPLVNIYIENNALTHFPKQMSKLCNLEYIFCCENNIEEAEIERVQKQLPSCDIVV